MVWGRVFVSDIYKAWLVGAFMPDISVYDSRSDGISFSFINMPKTQKTGKMLTTIDLFHLAPVFLERKSASEKIFSQVQPIGFTR